METITTEGTHNTVDLITNLSHREKLAFKALIKEKELFHCKTAKHHNIKVL